MNQLRERKKPGPKPKYAAPRREYHLKFPSELSDYIDERAKAQGYQAFFDELVRQHMQTARRID